MAVLRYLVDDVDAAIAFYTQHLGFTLEQQMGPHSESSLATIFALAQRPAELGRAADARWAATGARRLEPPRCRDRRSRDQGLELKRAGLSFRTRSWPVGGKQIVLEDGDGNPIRELFEARPR